MTKRRKWMLIWGAGTLVLVPGLFVLGYFRSERQVASLLSQAGSRGIPIELPVEKPNPRAQQILEAMKKLPHLDTDGDSSDLAGIDRTLKRGGPHWAQTKMLLQCEPLTSAQPMEFIGPILTAKDLIDLRGRLAIVSGDFEGLVDAALSTRRLASLLPPHDFGAVMLFTLVHEVDCNLLQEAAEAMTLDAGQCRRLEELVDEWGEPDFKVAASYRLATELAYEDDPELPPAGLTVVEQLEDAWERTPTRVNGRKTEIIRQEIASEEMWNRPDDLLDESSSERSFVATLKTLELKAVSITRALRLTLRAYRTRAEGKPWPTIEQLAEMGLETNDPIKGEAYTWADCAGAQRVVGWKEHRDRQRGIILRGGNDHRSRSLRSTPSQQPF